MITISPSRSNLLVVAAILSMVSISAAQDRPAGGKKEPVKVDPAPPMRVFVPQQGGIQRILRAPGGLQIDDPLDLKRVRTASVPSEIIGLIDDLAANDFETRVEAMLALRVHSAADHCLMAVLDEGDLLEEQRIRLLSTVEWRIVNRPRGAVGIRMMPRARGVQPAGIEVQEVISGLPAERVLRVGDVLVRLDGREVGQNQDLILHVQQMRPGEKVAVDLLRPVGMPVDGRVPDDFVEGDQGRWYQPIAVELALGSYEQLGDDRGVQNAETTRRQLYVERIRGQWGDPPVRKVLRPPAADVVRPVSPRR